MRLDRYVAGAANAEPLGRTAGHSERAGVRERRWCAAKRTTPGAGRRGITLNGQPLVLQRYVYIVLDKPKGVGGVRRRTKNDM